MAAYDDYAIMGEYLDHLMAKGGMPTATEIEIMTKMFGFPKTPIAPPPPVNMQAGSISSGVFSGVASGPIEPYTSEKLRRMIGMRLHMADTSQWPFEFICPHRSKDTVFVCIVHEGKPAILEDEFAMFPSDALITKLRLLIG